MENVKSKPLSYLIFFPLLVLVFIRPFFSGLTYPALELYYENILIFLAILTFVVEIRYRFRIVPDYFDNFPVLALLLAYSIATVYSVNPQNSIKITLTFISYSAVFFTLSQADERQKNLIIKTIVISASIIGLYAIYQYFWGYQHTIDYLKRINSDFLETSSYARDILLAKRSIGTFPSPNILGSFLVVAFFLNLRLLYKSNYITHYTLHITQNTLSLVVIIFALVLTKSMGAWLSLIFTLAILFLISYKSLRQRKMIIMFFIAGIVLALGFILVTRWERLLNLENPQNSITQRLSYWRASLGMIRAHPIFGVGPGNFRDVFLKYKPGLGTNTRYAHNIFLHSSVEAGVLGLAAILYLIINFLRKFKNRKENKFVLLAGIAFLAHNLIDNTFFIPQTGLFFWILLGLCQNQSGRRTTP